MKKHVSLPCLLVALGGMLLAGSVATGDVRPTAADADRLQQKLVTIAAYGAARSREAHLTPISERECNAFFQFRMKETLPAGVTEPSLRILGNGRLAGSAVVDLDAVRESRSRGRSGGSSGGDWLDPINLLSGKLPATAQGTLHTRDGVAQFRVESAEIGGVAVPKALLQQVVAYYSRTPDNPEGFDLEAPFRLPSGIREIRVGTGEAVVVQ
ncbi:MAG: hypothetical protein GEU99_04965 [Luteitalea sp.]|nr:hypothetical protein [Luteitalea sp.]